MNQNALYEAIIEGRAPVKAKVVETDKGYRATVNQWGVESTAEAQTSSHAQNQAVSGFLKQVQQGKHKINKF